MIALLLYPYNNGRYSSKRIARACEERLDCQAVTALNRPDFRTISVFRRRHLKALAGLFTQMLALCHRTGLRGLNHVAVDGTEIKANASKHKAMSYGRMEKATDVADDALHGSDRCGDEPPNWMRDKQARLALIRAAKAEHEAEAKEAQSRKTTPERCPMNYPLTADFARRLI